MSDSSIWAGIERIRYYFGQIAAIPHGSGNERELSGYIRSTIEKMGLRVIQDDQLNIVAFKDGTQGYENAPAVILQAHMDMVCAAGGEYDFIEKGIELCEEDGFLAAHGTTLGADDAIGVCYILALLESTDIPHPPIEAVITAGEETGMDGARELDTSVLTGRRMINLDMEEEGTFTVSCAGGVRFEAILPVEKQPLPSGMDLYEITVHGLHGGHSGMEIVHGYANANVIIGELLKDLCGKLNIYICDITGGEKENAIARDCRVIAAINTDAADKLRGEVVRFQNALREKYGLLEKSLALSCVKSSEAIKWVYSPITSRNLMNLLCGLPNGVYTMSEAIAGLPESSSNIGVVRAYDESIIVSGTVRSSSRTGKQELRQRISELVRQCGAAYSYNGDYPAWEYCENSPLRELMIKAYSDMYGLMPVVGAVHAGLECGLLSEKMPHTDMIALGPDITGAHTPQERMSIASAKRVWEFLCEVMGRMGYTNE